VPGDHPLGCLAEVVPQVPPVGDLDRVRGVAGTPSNGTVGYQKCLNAVAWGVVSRVTAWLIVVSSWSVRSSRLLART
jgi:hypothetical protein